MVGGFAAENVTLPLVMNPAAAPTSALFGGLSQGLYDMLQAGRERGGRAGGVLQSCTTNLKVARRKPSGTTTKKGATLSRWATKSRPLPPPPPRGVTENLSHPPAPPLPL